MPDLERDPERPDRPVAEGLIALVGVAVIVGLILGIGALGATKIVGLDGGSGGDGSGAAAPDSLYLPHPQPTDPASGPLVTLAPNQTGKAKRKAPAATRSASAKPEPAGISLSAGQTEVAPMEEIDLAGTYPDGEGAILEVQELERGKWTPFDASMSVTGGVFSSYIYTGIEGRHTYRVIDNETGTASNKIVVTVG